MSIESEKVKLATERFLLIRITPARFIQPALLSGSTYSQTFPYPIARVERNGIELTRVTSVVDNDDYSYNESALELQVKLASAPDSTSNILVVYFYLFYTGTVFRSIYEDPEDDTTTVRDWQPRIKNYPSISQSFENIVNGVFTISDTSIDIINSDHVFQEYLTADDSFYNKAVEIWLCINSSSNIIKVFSGEVVSLNTTQNMVSINVVDSFNKLKQPAYMGDTADESIFRLSGFGDLNPRDTDLPCPYVVGLYSRYKTRAKSGMPAASTIAYEIDVATPAACTSFTPTVSTTNNRTWGTCRQSSSIPTQAFGTIEATTVSGNFRFIRFSSLSNVAIGDTFKWVEAAVTYYSTVNYVGTFTYSAVSYNLVVSDPTGTFTVSSTVTNLKSFAVIIDAPDQTLTYLQPRYTRDFSITETTTSGGNKYIEIVFGGNFESSFAGYTALDPSKHTVSFRTSNDSPQKHGEMLRTMMEKVGLPVNSATFAYADFALPVYCRFHIPNFDEDSADSYLKYAEDILSSTLGYLRISNLFEVEYYLLSTPVGLSSRDSFLMLDNDSRCEINYQDIATEIIAYNPHCDSADAIVGANTPAATGASNKSKFLHGLVNVNRFRHVLEEMTSKITDHINLKSQRSCVYTFSTASEDIDSELGDGLTLDNSIVLGSSNISDVTILSLEKSPGRISVKASDLVGL